MIGYRAIRAWLKVLLHIYFGKIEVHGVSNVPDKKPVLFLPNHQNAFLDTILIGTACNRSPYFLTRSDVFKSPLLNKLFTFCKMIPIYRMRDGIESLKHNQNTFDKCVNLFEKNEAIVIFPEANHNLERRVRPLSKGFTRILINTLEANPNLDVQLVPVGLNYKKAASFPDKAAVYYGNPISVQKLFEANDIQGSVERIKNAVFENLITLTTHIDSKDYKATIGKLDLLNTDYLDPKAVNNTLMHMSTIAKTPVDFKKVNRLVTLKDIVFIVVNFPILILWRKVKPKVKETEFLSTFRFAFSVVMFPLYYGFIFVVTSLIWNFSMGLLVVSGVLVYNLLYTKIN